MHPVSRVLVCLSTFVIVSHATSPMTTTSRDNTWSPLTAVDLSTLLPLTWRSMCRAKHISLFDDVNIIISCHRTVEDNVHWRLDDLNVSLEPVVMTTRTEVELEIECDSGTNISLPLPMRVLGLVKLKVTGCRLLDKYSNFDMMPFHSNNSLRILEMRNCTWVTELNDFKKMTTYINDDYNCGQDSSIVEFVYSNVRDVFIRRNDTDVNGSSEAVTPDRFENRTIDLALEILHMVDSAAPCNFSKLQVLDESDNPYVSKHEWELMRRNSFPRLRVMNYSRVNMTEVPGTLLEWRRFFKRLEMLDLSYNSIQRLVITFPYSLEIVTTFNLQHNNITHISMDDVKNWVKARNFYVDVRNNPIDCNCDIGDFLLHLGNESQWMDPSMAYYKSYIPDMTCASPLELAGRTLGSLSAHELFCPVTPLDLKPITDVLLGAAVISLILLLIVVRYRQEVRILFFTRAHVMLPCGRPLMTSDLCPEKKYDAFVSYAHQDSDWVTQTLCPRLEHTISPTYDRPLKLCIHQRDFIVGKPIIDNIIDCIAASRHTIIVLTPSFVQSSWAMEELQQAFRQSMEERRRHLLLVVLETVPQSDMAPVLRRCCKTFTYLEVSHALFWDRLVYSLHADVGKFPKLKTNHENGFDNVITIEDNIGTENGDSKDLDSSWSADHLGRRLPPSMHVETMRTVSVDSTSTVSTTISDDAFSMN